jgi:hypothetical protein
MSFTSCFTSSRPATSSKVTLFSFFGTKTFALERVKDMARVFPLSMPLIKLKNKKNY